MKQEKNLKVYHPFLFALFPVYFLFHQMIHRVAFSETFTPAICVLIFAYALLSLLKSIYKNIYKAAILTSFLLIALLSFGRILTKYLFYVQNATAILLASILIITLVLAIFLCRAKFSFLLLNRFLNVMSSIILAMIFMQIGIYLFQVRNAYSFFKEELQEVIPLNSSGPQRDIYYIIFDGYAHHDTLKNMYHFDNSDILNFLREKGFYIAENATSNYPQTFLSLTTSLNMNYQNDLIKAYGRNKKDRRAPYSILRDNLVMRSLKAAGYKIISFSSGWRLLNKFEDVDPILSKQFGFYYYHKILIQTTILKLWEQPLIAATERYRFRKQTDDITTIPNEYSPKFVFVKFDPPHPPYLFNEKGESTDKPIIAYHSAIWSDQISYLKQVEYVNSKIKSMVTRILANSKIKPIIIIQSDHGSESTLYGQDRGSWEHPTSIFFNERMRIFNAYYLPDGVDKKLYSEITPVNTFRLIFNEYFSSDLPLIKDRNFYSTYRKPYDIKDVTSNLHFDPSEIN